MTIIVIKLSLRENICSWVVCCGNYAVLFLMTRHNKCYVKNNIVSALLFLYLTTILLCFFDCRVDTLYGSDHSDYSDYLHVNQISVFFSADR